jgi:NAD+ kinase
VVHPSRAIDRPLFALREWASPRNVELVQIRASCRQQSVAELGNAEDCDLLVSIGGDGTTLAAIRAGALAGRPVLPIACGSLGVLTSVAAREIVDAIERFSRGAWVPWSPPALEVVPECGAPVLAFNDIAIVRASGSQVRLTVDVDGNRVVRIAGDGCIVSTPIGSSAYALAAGGPLLAPDVGAFLFTPLASHGGSCPPVVIGAASAIRLTVTAGHGAARLEVDGRRQALPLDVLTIGFRAAVARVVTFRDHAPFPAVLRKRRIITDSPRVLAEDARNRLKRRGRSSGAPTTGW